MLWSADSGLNCGYQALPVPPSAAKGMVQALQQSVFVQRCRVCWTEQSCLGPRSGAQVGRAASCQQSGFDGLQLHARNIEWLQAQSIC